LFGARLIFESARQEPEKDIYQKSHDQARGLKTDRVAIIFINKYLTQFIPGKQEGYATTTESLPHRLLFFWSRGRELSVKVNPSLPLKDFYRFQLIDKSSTIVFN
jgi:hypothetical protein